MNGKEMIYNSAKTGKRRKGQKELLRFLNGERLTRQQAINGKCYDCDGMGESGVCDITECTLYSYSPFVKK